MKPLTLLIKPAAGLCNMSCRYCFYKEASGKRENRIMSEETVDALIDRISEAHPFSLSVLFQGGEPTLAGPGFLRAFVKKVKEKVRCPVSYALQTNGLLIDDDYARFFKENSFLVGLSLDGEKSTNDRYRKAKDGKSVFEKVLDSAAILKSHGVDFNILSVIDDSNAADIEKTYGFFKENCFDYLQFIPCNDEGIGVSLSAENYETFLKKSFDLWYGDLAGGKYVSIRHIDNYVGIILGRSPENCAMCGLCGNYFVVEANGDLYPCDFYCTDENRLGSVFDEKPFEMSEKQRRFIEESKRIHEHCKGCRYYALCRGGCKKDRMDDFSKNRYCKAYYGFFEYAGERMLKAAEVFGG